MHDYPPVKLTYFDARGRAQFLRYYFRCRDIPFEDDRVPLTADFASWQAVRENRTITGPFQKLPVLHWGNRVVSETTVIAAFLHDVSGDAALLPADENLRHSMLISAAYVDLMLPIGILLWSELMFPGADFAATAQRTLERMQYNLAVIDRTLDEWQWLERAPERPVTVVDCLLWEEVDVALNLFGDALSLDATPTLARLYRGCAARGTFARLLETRPCQITGRPGEADAIARIQSAVRVPSTS
jgi:glutathione S-transferase